jgi:hypothetical protein
VDVALVDEPRKVGRIAIACVRRQPLRPQAEALLCALDHAALRSDLGLAHRCCRLHIDDHSMIEIDQIVG